jgi:hypothetical protein
MTDRLNHELKVGDFILYSYNIMAATDDVFLLQIKEIKNGFLHFTNGQWSNTKKFWNFITKEEALT